MAPLLQDYPYKMGRTCDVCGNDGEFYMVHDYLWLQAMSSRPSRHLCLRCLGERLGRPVVATDLRPVDVNSGLLWWHLSNGGELPEGSPLWESARRGEQIAEAYRVKGIPRPTRRVKGPPPDDIGPPDQWGFYDLPYILVCIETDGEVTRMPLPGSRLAPAYAVTGVEIESWKEGSITSAFRVTRVYRSKVDAVRFGRRFSPRADVMIERVYIHRDQENGAEIARVPAFYLIGTRFQDETELSCSPRPSGRAKGSEVT